MEGKDETHRILKKAADRIDTDIENLPKTLQRFTDSLEKNRKKIKELEKKLED